MHPGSYQVREQTGILIYGSGRRNGGAGSDELFLTRDGETKKIELRALEVGPPNERTVLRRIVHAEGVTKCWFWVKCSPGYYSSGGDRLDAIGRRSTADA